MLSELLEKIKQSSEVYGLGDFDFSEVADVQANGLITCKLLQRAGIYNDCLVLGEFDYPAIGDQGILLLVGKQKYPCFYSFKSGNLLDATSVVLTSISENTNVNFTNLSEDFISRVKQISEEVGIKYEWLLLLMYFESDFNPQAVSRTGAVGLIQWTTPRAIEDGVTKEQLLKMTALQQLDYVEIDFLRAKGILRNLQDVCMYVFLPVMIGKGADDKFPAPQDGMTTPREYVNKVIFKAKNAGYAVDEIGEIKLYNTGGIELKSNINVND